MTIEETPSYPALEVARAVHVAESIAHGSQSAEAVAAAQASLEALKVCYEEAGLPWMLDG